MRGIKRSSERRAIDQPWRSKTFRALAGYGRHAAMLSLALTLDCLYCPLGLPGSQVSPSPRELQPEGKARAVDARGYLLEPVVAKLQNGGNMLTQADVELRLN